MTKTEGRMKAKDLPPPSEHIEQTNFVEWFKLAYPGILIHSVPNGAALAGSPRLRAAQLARLKAEGLEPGIPDLHIPSRNLWIEMKRQSGGRLSPEQRHAIHQLESLGDTVIVAKGWEAAKAAVLAHMGAGA